MTTTVRVDVLAEPEPLRRIDLRLDVLIDGVEAGAKYLLKRGYR